MKYGLNYQIVDDLRLRYTNSRNVRAPNINELFLGLSQSNPNQVYFGVTTPSIVNSSGNPNLQPEISNAQTYGAVFSPSFIPGLQASVDYYSIEIEGAISSLSDIVGKCVAGDQYACGFITVTPSQTLIIASPLLNLDYARNSASMWRSPTRENCWMAISRCGCL